MLHSVVIDEISGEHYINGELAIEIENCESSPTGESGGTRAVFLTSEYVLKFDSEREHRFNYALEDAKHFAEVVYVSIYEEWLIQKRVQCVPHRCSKKSWKVIETLAQKYNL